METVYMCVHDVVRGNWKSRERETETGTGTGNGNGKQKRDVALGG